MCKLLMWMQQAGPIRLTNNLVGPQTVVSNIAFDQLLSLCCGVYKWEHAQVGVMLISRHLADLPRILIFYE